jgi:peroxiredoxin
MITSEHRTVDPFDTSTGDPEQDDQQGRVGYGRYARYTPAALGLALIVTIAIIGWLQWRPDDDLPRAGALVDQPAPEFTLELLNGETINSGDYLGSALALNFWASWCAPCKTEMPALNDIAAQYPATAVLGVGIKRDNDENARALVEELGLDYPIGRDTAGSDPVKGPIEIAFGVTTYPATVFIRPDGTVFAVTFGPLTESEAREYLDATLQ